MEERRNFKIVLKTRSEEVSVAQGQDASGEWLKLSSLGFLDHRVVWSSADAGQTVPEVVRRSFVRRSSEREHSI